MAKNLEMLDADMALANRKAYEQKMVQFIAGALVRCLFARMNRVRGRSGRVRSGCASSLVRCTVMRGERGAARRRSARPGRPLSVVG